VVTAIRAHSGIEITQANSTSFIKTRTLLLVFEIFKSTNRALTIAFWLREYILTSATFYFLTLCIIFAFIIISIIVYLRSTPWTKAKAFYHRISLFFCMSETSEIFTAFTFYLFNLRLVLHLDLNMFFTCLTNNFLNFYRSTI
jgi:hypothetical protein